MKRFVRIFSEQEKRESAGTHCDNCLKTVDFVFDNSSGSDRGGNYFCIDCLKEVVKIMEEQNA